MTKPIYNWQQKGWPKAVCARSVLRDELKAFGSAFKSLKKALKTSQDIELVARTLTDEAVKTSAIEGVRVDESAVMSSICKALGVAYAPKGFVRDARAEGVAQMMLCLRENWNSPLSAKLLTTLHGALMAGEEKRVAVGAFRSHKEPMRVICQHADGTIEVRYVAPPSEKVPEEIDTFVRMWNEPAAKPVDIALKAAMIHPHFESIHPFEDGNGRVGRALVAKVLAEGLGHPLVMPISAVIARHRTAYYDEINEASRSLDWTNWAAFFIPLLTEMMVSFVAAMRFVAAKREFLLKYELGFSPRAKKVVLRMFKDGEKGVVSGLSVAKWMRMTKVSKPTATRDLSELVTQGAIVREGLGGSETRYRLNCSVCEPSEPLNEPLNDRLIKLVQTHPGAQLTYLKSVVGASTATVKRAVAALVKAGRIEHRGSKKTGGYFPLDKESLARQEAALGSTRKSRHGATSSF